MPVTVIESQLLHREDRSRDAYVAWLQLGCCVARAGFKSLACLSCDLVSVCGGWGFLQCACLAWLHLLSCPAMRAGQGAHTSLSGSVFV